MRDMPISTSLEMYLAERTISCVTRQIGHLSFEPMRVTVLDCGHSCVGIVDFAVMQTCLRDTFEAPVSSASVVTNFALKPHGVLFFPSASVEIPAI